MSNVFINIFNSLPPETLIKILVKDNKCYQLALCACTQLEIDLNIVLGMKYWDVGRWFDLFCV